jgi:hypothetical protein
MTEAERHELAEAEALAQALERDAALPDLPADALQTAAFLRFNTKDAELGDAAEQRIFTELQGTFERTPQPRSPSWFSPRRLLLWLTPALALGALSFIVVFRQQSASLSAPRVTTQVSHLETPRLSASEQSALCDLAEQQLNQGQTEGALRTIADGLLLSATPSATLARLYMLKAQAHERRGETILANDSYFQALQINQQLLHQSLGK